MNRPYFCCYHSYLDNIELLTDAERGRLFTAMLEYSNTGVTSPLVGNEKYVFSGIRSQIDRDKDKWRKDDEAKVASGKMGGRPRKSAADPQKELSGKPSVLERTLENRTFSEKPPLSSKSLEKKKNKEMEMDNISSSSTSSETDEEIFAKNLAKCCYAYEQNIGTLPRAVMDEMRIWIEKLSADMVCEALNEASICNKRSWSYARAVLKRCEQQNIRTVAAYRSEKENHQANARRPAGGRRQTAQDAFLALAKGGDDVDDAGNGGVDGNGYNLLAEPDQGN